MSAGLADFERLEAAVLREEGRKGYVHLINMLLSMLGSRCRASLEGEAIVLRCGEWSRVLHAGAGLEDALEVVYALLLAVYLCRAGGEG